MSEEMGLHKYFSIQVTGIYYSDKNIPQGKERSRSSIDLGLKKRLWNKKAELTFSASDILNRFGIRQRVYDQGLTAIYQNYFETQIFRVGFKYKI